MIDVRVAAVRDEGRDIRSLELHRTDGQLLPAFSAGAHIDVHLPAGIVRQYSLCNSPHETQCYRIAVLREPASRGGSAAVHALATGDVLQIGMPRNLFPLHDGATHSLLFAGGIGITPMLAMAEQLAVNDERFELHYCARSPAHAAFLQHLMLVPWLESVHLHFDNGTETQRLDIARVLANAAAATHLYVCGPDGFMRHVLDAGRDAGWDAIRLHSESFATPVLAEHDDTPFEVELASNGEVFTIMPGQSIARALDAAGVFVPVSCEQGICGTCLTGVIRGEPDHRDRFLTDEEHARHDQIALCCSRARSPRLVLDL